MTHTTSLNRAGSSTTNTSSQPYKDRGKLAFAQIWNSSLPPDKYRQASKNSMSLHQRYSAFSQQGKCCEHQVPSSARLDRSFPCCPIYTKLSLLSFSAGEGGGGDFSQSFLKMKQGGGKGGRGVFPLYKTSNETTFGNNITSLSFSDYLLIYSSSVMMEEFHIYSPNS